MDERIAQDLANRRRYETTMSEWLAVEAIVRQRDREATAASIARLAETQPTEHNPEVIETEIQNLYHECIHISIKI